MTTTQPEAGMRAPLGERVSDGVVLSFAAWTVLANLTVLLGGNLIQLLITAGLALSAVGAVAWTRRGRARAPLPARAPAAEPDPAHPTVLRIALAQAGASLVIAYALTEETKILWLGLLLLSGLWVILELGSSPSASVRPKSSASAVIVLCAVCAVVALVAHRPDPDDAFYLNLAVSVADHPSAPIMAGDTLHGLPGVPLALPVYRSHSIELLSAAISTLSGLRVPDVSHLLFPLIAAILIPLALVRVARQLTPERWLWTAGFAVLFLLCAGESHYSYGSTGLTRLHQGKGIFLNLVIPLVIAYGIEFAQAPTWRRWLLLAAAQVAGVGLTASALWIGPVVAGLTVLAATSLRDGRGAARTLALGLASSAYVIALALTLRGETMAAFENAIITLASTRMPGDELTRASARYVLWLSPLAWGTLLALTSSWSLATSVLHRRFAAWFVLVFALVFWNPWTAEWIANHITGAPTQWRVFWLLPVPILVGASLSAPWELLGRRIGGALCVGLALLLVALPQKTPFSDMSYSAEAAGGEGGWLGVPTWKIPVGPLRIARQLRDHAPVGSLVLAPMEVLPWIPVLHDHPTPLFVRHVYLPVLIPLLGEADVERRVRLGRLVSGVLIPPHAGEVLASAIDDYSLGGLAIHRAAVEKAKLGPALERSPLERVYRDDIYEVWARETSP